MYNTFEANNIETVIQRQVDEGLNAARFRQNQQSKFASELKKFHDQISQRRSRLQRIMAGDFFKKATLGDQFEKVYQKRDKTTSKVRENQKAFDQNNYKTGKQIQREAYSYVKNNEDKTKQMIK